jgi:hypothetical protein
MRATKHLQERPLCERLEFTIGLDHSHNLAIGEKLDSARETSTFPTRTFRKAAHYAGITTKQAHSL